MKKFNIFEDKFIDDNFDYMLKLANLDLYNYYPREIEDGRLFLYKEGANIYLCVKKGDKFYRTLMTAV